MMTRQEVYDRVKSHLLKQMRRSVVQDNHRGDLICMYRGAGGRSCAIGCLIPDELYDPVIERVSVTAISEDADRGERLKRILERSGVALDIEFLNSLQIVHDCTYPDEWKHELAIVAHEYGLIP